MVIAGSKLAARIAVQSSAATLCTVPEQIGERVYAAAKLDSSGQAVGHQVDVFGDKHPEVGTLVSLSAMQSRFERGRRSSARVLASLSSDREDPEHR